MTELKSDALKAVNFVEAGTEQTATANPAKKAETLRLSETRLAIFFIVSAVISFVLLRLATDDEIVLVWGTLNLAVISMWCLAFISKFRRLSTVLKRNQTD